MKKYEIMIDGYGPRVSTCFHKIITAADRQTADNAADKWCDELMLEDEGDFDEWCVAGLEEYTGTEHNVGEQWTETVPHLVMY